MLEYNFNGIKTGYTNSAGPCLSVSMKMDNLNRLKNNKNMHYYNNDEGVHLIIVLLNSMSMDARWRDAIKLIQWS